MTQATSIGKPGPTSLLNLCKACELGPRFSCCSASAGPGLPTKVTQAAVPGPARAPG